VRLRVIKPTPDVVLDLDLDLMVHALANILSNGAEAALASGRADPEVILAAQSTGGGVRLTIEDNGPGVCASDGEAIFRPFFTTKAHGSGVGLSFARQVVLSHGGSLTLSPAVPGSGARFAVAL
jgi:signal transduction histidine kinase